MPSKRTLLRIGILLLLSGIFVIGLVIFPRSGNGVQNVGNNTYKVPTGTELVLIQPGKNSNVWHITNNNGAVTFTWGMFSKDTVSLCGVGCKKEVTEDLFWTFEITENEDASITIKTPFGFIMSS